MPIQTEYIKNDMFLADYKIITLKIAILKKTEDRVMITSRYIPTQKNCVYIIVCCKPIYESKKIKLLLSACSCRSVTILYDSRPSTRVLFCPRDEMREQFFQYFSRI